MYTTLPTLGRSVVLAFCCGALVGCGGPSVESYADFDVAQTRTTISAAKRCCGGLVLSPGVFEKDEEKVLQGYASDPSTKARWAEIQAAIDDGEVVYDRDAAHACLASLSAALSNCEGRFTRGDPICSQVLRGQLAPGAVCTTDFSCVAGFCAGKYLFTSTGSGKCFNNPANEETCASGHCANGLRCNEISRCRTQRANGMLCNSSLDCASEACTEGRCAPAAPKSVREWCSH